ncbi:hypothetical protein [Chlorogloeopsis sp. ULAP02]|uniref:hypothetical protein n=1 Tax=Chlorogloeopsis sp. ULAP02 TaxID=3107926 RepID=UPI003137485E
MKPCLHYLWLKTGIASQSHSAVNVMGDITVSAVLDSKKPRSLDEVKYIDAFANATGL